MEGRRRIETKREGWQPTAVGPPAGVALEVAEVREITHFDVAAQLRDQVTAILRADLKDGETVDVREDRGPERAVNRIQLGQRLRDEDEARPVLGELAEHSLVIRGSECARLVDERDQTAALSRRQVDLFFDDETEEVEQRSA